MKYLPSRSWLCRGMGKIGVITNHCRIEVDPTSQLRPAGPRQGPHMFDLPTSYRVVNITSSWVHSRESVVLKYVRYTLQKIRALNSCYTIDDPQLNALFVRSSHNHLCSLPLVLQLSGVAIYSLVLTPVGVNPLSAVYPHRFKTFLSSHFASCRWPLTCDTFTDYMTEGAFLWWK